MPGGLPAHFGEASPSLRHEGEFRKLVEDHRDRIVRIACAITGDPHAADDIAQEVFVRAFEGLRGFRGQSSVGTWLVRIAVNLCRDFLRRRRRLEPLGTGLEQLVSLAVRPDESAQQVQLERALEGALAALPEKLRTVLVLSDLQGLPYREIGEALGLPLGTVRTRVQRARTLAKGVILRELGEESGWLR